MKKIILAGLALGLAFQAGAQQQQMSQEEMKQANNPLASVTAVNLHNYYVPKIWDADGATANTTWLRIAQPVGRVLLRASLPINTVPAPTSVSALGDASLFAVVLLGKTGNANQFGIGPMVVAPTSNNTTWVGSGKWQVGAAAMAFLAKNHVFQSGGLVTWQMSVAGQDNKPDVSMMTIQPFGMWQIGGGTYLRTAAIWTFDLESGYYNVPISMGIGKVAKVNKTVFNIFLEPQYSILHYGTGQPQLQLFAGLNMQFH